MNSALRGSIIASSMSGWQLQDGTGLLNVMALVTEDELDIMHTLDAEVRADVEAAARLLARQLQTHGCVGIRLFSNSLFDVKACDVSVGNSSWSKS